MPLFNETSLNALQGSMRGLGKRHDAATNNLANVDTPGYKREVVNFRDELQSAMSSEKNGLMSTNEKHFTTEKQDLASFRPSVEKEENTSGRVDENNVDIDAEMSNLAKTSLEYQASSSLVRDHFDRLTTVIDKGGR